MVWQINRGKSPSTTIFIKDSAENILRDERELLLRLRKYFADLLNPIRITPTDNCEAIEFWKDEILPFAGVSTHLRGLKFGKVSNEDVT